MEGILQWLDEVEDLVFTIALLWENMRRTLLKIGLWAALLLQFSQWAASSQAHAAVLAGIALASVVGWSAGALVLLVAAGNRARGVALA